MEEEYSGRLVFLAAFTIALAAFSLSTAWYTADVTHRLIGYTVTDYEVTFYAGYYEGGPGPFSGSYNGDYDMYVGDLMSAEQMLVLAWMLVGMAFIGSCLMESRYLSVGFSVVTMVIGFTAVGMFVGTMANALATDISNGYFEMLPNGMPFWGSIYGGGAFASGTPRLGFWLISLAAFLQAVVAIVSVKSVVLDRRGIREFQAVDPDPEQEATHTE
jgi:hypothetical protein